jgi:molecular chaperone GrpE (heat shock protein)
MDTDVDQRMAWLGEDAIKKQECAVQKQSNLACLDTFAPGSILYQQYIYARLGSLAEQLDKVKETLSGLEKAVGSLEQGLCRCVDAVRQCQQQTAMVLESQLERHALNPAIETVVFLAEEIFRLDKTAGKLANRSADKTKVNRFTDDLRLSSQLAREKLCHLDIEQILPSSGDDLDTDRHIPCSCSDTDDEGLNGKISELITPGIAYRGKVLQKARVAVFRCSEKRRSTKQKVKGA